MKTYIQQNQTLLEALEKLAPGSSKNTLRAWLRDGRVLLDKRRVIKPSLQVSQGQELEVVEHKMKKEGPLLILYEDNHVVVIEKPTGLLSVATDFEQEKTAHAILKRRYKPRRVFVIHRLDQDTSGLMIFALSDTAYYALKASLAKHEVERIYYGVVAGEVKKAGSWCSYLQEDENYVVHSSQDPSQGEKAVTHFAPIRTKGDKTLMRFKLETGKKNQIRVQARDAKCPLIGDRKYGDERCRNYPRLYLHAANITFIHPIFKKEFKFSSEIPESFFAII